MASTKANGNRLRQLRGGDRQAQQVRNAEPERLTYGVWVELGRQSDEPDGLVAVREGAGDLESRVGAWVEPNQCDASRDLPRQRRCRT